MAYTSHKVEKRFSSQITDLAFNSGEYDSLTDKRETTYIKNGKVVTEKTPYGIKPEN